MKRFFLISFGVLVLLALAMVYSVWRETQAPVTHASGAVETGRAQLRAQLEQAKKTEGDTERQHWNSPGQLNALAEGHKQRIEKLKDNMEAAEIVAYDRDAVDRLEKRIAQIAEEEAARVEAEKEAAKQAAEEAQPQ